MLFRFAVPAIVVLAFPFIVRADLVGTVTMASGDRYSLDTGETFAAGSSAGDIRFSGTSVVSQGEVGIYNYKTSGAAGTTLYNSLNQQALASLPAGSYSTTTTLNAAALVVGDVFAVHTSAGFYAKVLITSFTSGSSLGLQYTTFGAASGGANAPIITAIENAATNIPPGLPNAAIAQGALFVVKGRNLGPANAVVASAFPLRTSDRKSVV